MALLREEPVDISRYLPHFLRKDLSMAGILDACSKEHERQRLTLLDVLDQFFVATATPVLCCYSNMGAFHMGACACDSSTGDGYGGNAAKSNSFEAAISPNIHGGLPRAAVPTLYVGR